MTPVLFNFIESRKSVKCICSRSKPQFILVFDTLTLYIEKETVTIINKLEYNIICGKENRHNTEHHAVLKNMHSRHWEMVCNAEMGQGGALLLIALTKMSSQAACQTIASNNKPSKK